MTCEGKNYPNMNYEERCMHAQFHSQKAREAAAVGDGKAWNIEDLKGQIMAHAVTEALMPGQMKVHNRNVRGVSLEVYIAGLQMQLTALEAEGGQTND